MKRIVAVLCVIGFLAAMPVSHQLLAKGGPADKVEICHVTGEIVAGDIVVGFFGHVISVSANALDAHLAHGDSLTWAVRDDGSCAFRAAQPE